MTGPVEKPGPAPELSRPLPAERLGGTAYRTRIVANPAERAALAARFGLSALERLEARVRVSPSGSRDRGARVRLEGHVDAVVIQACVVSLEPVHSTLSENFSQLYSLDPVEGPAQEVAVAPGAEEEEPEPLGPGGLDLGEAVAQQLALMLDPYPRASGASMPAALKPDEPAGRDRRRPFAALRDLKPR